jgi:hypothetical protein
MPFAKAGGVTWGGQVHDTGNFGRVCFVSPTEEQRASIEKRILQAAWFRFLASAKRATTLWNDDELGDPVFFNDRLKPVIDRYTVSGESLGDPGAWDSKTVSKAWEMRNEWMEFPYVVSELRNEFLREKRFGAEKTGISVPE